MDLFFEVQRGKMHVFCDAKESSTVLELKRIIQGITKVSPEDQLLLKRIDECSSASDPKMAANWTSLEDNVTLQDSGFGTNNAKAQLPAVLAFACRNPTSGQFEEIQIEPLSVPPPLPDVMRSADSAPSVAVASSAVGEDKLA